MKKQLIERELEVCMAELNSLGKDGSVCLRSNIFTGKHDFLDAPMEYKKNRIEGKEGFEPSSYDIMIQGHTINVVRSKYCTAEDRQMDKIFEMKAFVDWCNKFDRRFFGTYIFKQIEIHSIDMFGPRIGFLKFKPIIFEYQKDKNKRIVMKDGVEQKTEVSSITFMRGNSVAMLPIFHCEGKIYTCVTVQHRVPAAQYAFKEIPAGMMDEDGNFFGVAAKELKEEMGLRVHQDDLIDMLQVNKMGNTEEGGDGIFMSPGGCDESIRFYLYRTDMQPDELKSLQGKCTGNLEEGEKITLEIMELKDLSIKCADAKSFVALYLYFKVPPEYKYAPQKENLVLDAEDLNSIRNLLWSWHKNDSNGIAQYSQEVASIPKFLETVIRRHFVINGITADELKILKRWAEDELDRIEKSKK